MMNAQKKGDARRSLRTKTGWSPERKARQAQAIRRWRPWSRSTGPTTPAGKRKSAGNAEKRWAASREFRALCAGLKAVARLHGQMGAYSLALRRTRKNPACELLKDRRWRLDKAAYELASLHIEFQILKIMQKSCNFRPPDANS